MEVILSGKQEKWHIKRSVDLLTWNGAFRAALCTRPYQEHVSMVYVVLYDGVYSLSLCVVE